MPANRNTKRGKRTTQGETVASITEGEARREVQDGLHLAYTQSGVVLTHLTVRAKRMLGYPAEATASIDTRRG